MQKAPALALRPDRPKSDSTPLAERQAAQQDVFLREVDDALRQDEALGLLRRYGKPVGALVAAGLLGLAGYLWWDHRGNEAAGKQGEELTIALDRLEAGGLASAEKQLAPLAKDGGEGTAAAAKLLQAGIALEQGKRDVASRLFAEVSADDGAPQPFRDLATIREVAVRFDAMAPQQVVDRLKPLAVPGNPWFGNAGELLGIAYMKQGRNDLAGPLFAQIARDKETPDTLRSRARQIAGLLGVDAVDDPEKMVAAQAGDQPAEAAPPPAAQN